MSTQKMQQVLENLAYVIGKKPLIDVGAKKRVSEETVAAMTGPIAKPFAPEIRRKFPVGEEEVPSTGIPEGGKPAGNPPVGDGEPQQGGDPSCYGKESTKSHYPHKDGEVGMGESKIARAKKLTQEAEELIGKSLIGGPESHQGGDPSNYDKEKEAPKAELKEDDEKPEGKPVVGEPKEAKVDEPSQYDGEKDAPKAEVGESSKAVKAKKLTKEAEELLGQSVVGDPKAADGGDASCYGAEKEAPKAELKEEDEEKPEKTEKEYEIYATSDDLAAVSSRAIEAVKDKVVNPRSMLCVKFNSDDAAKDQAIEALRSAGFTVVGSEVEKESMTEEGNKDQTLYQVFYQGNGSKFSDALRSSDPDAKITSAVSGPSYMVLTSLTKDQLSNLESVRGVSVAPKASEKTPVDEAFSRKHYEEIAELISDSKDLDELVEKLIEFFQQDNPAFDAERFRAAVK